MEIYGIEDTVFEVFEEDLTEDEAEYANGSDLSDKLEAACKKVIEDWLKDTRADQ